MKSEQILLKKYFNGKPAAVYFVLHTHSYNISVIRLVYVTLSRGTFELVLDRYIVIKFALKHDTTYAYILCTNT